MMVTTRPWTALTPRVAEVLRPALPGAAESIFVDIAREIPSLGRDLDGSFGEAMHRGVDLGLARFLDLLGTAGEALPPELAQLYESFGEHQSREGQALDALLAAYRLGARLTWARFSTAALRGDVSTGELITLAEAIFEYIDELSAASARGHSRHHAAQAGYRDVQRSRLAAAILAGELATAPARVRRLADEVGWPVPERLAVAILNAPEPAPVLTPAVLVYTGDAPGGGRAAGGVPGGGDQTGNRPDAEPDTVVILPDPSSPERLNRLTAGLGRRVEIYLGTVRPGTEAALSLADARSVQRLVRAGILPHDRLQAAVDHLPELVLHADPRLLAELRARELAPLAALQPRRQRELTETLRCWLAQQGNRVAVAAELGIHPQTVSYRMAQLDELLGSQLHDSRRRLGLLLALEAGAGPERASGPQASGTV